MKCYSRRSFDLLQACVCWVLGYCVKLHIDKIGDEGLDLDEPIEVSWLQEALGSGSPYVASQNGRFRVRLTRIDETVHMRGSMDLVLEGRCGRCLCAVPAVVSHPLELALVPRGVESSEVSDEGEITEDDVGISVYENHQIDFASVIRDEVFLELPMHVLCSESCAGLCNQCGKNLNEGSCGCKPAVDFRWSTLESMKLH